MRLSVNMKSKFLTKQIAEMKIIIKHCTAFNEEFADLKIGTIHEIIETPKEYSHLNGVWVMGKTEPVRLIPGEYEIID